MLTVSSADQWDLVAVTQMQYVLEDVQTRLACAGQETAEHRDVCVLKAEQVVEVSVQQELHYIAALLLTAIVPVALTTITAEQFVIILVVFGLPVPMAATLIDVVDSRV